MNPAAATGINHLVLTRTHDTPDCWSEAVYSDCGGYRYRLTRRWADGPLVNFVMLNPSVADEQRNDPTVERCERRARQDGFSAFTVTNIFAWRDTDPRALRRASAPEGEANDAILLSAARDADLVVAAWGVHGAHRGRGPEVARNLRSVSIALHHLGLTRDGHPRHPLYVPYARRALPWTLDCG